MEDLQLLIDLHKGADRQGPGGDTETEKALDISMLDRSEPLKIADIGCGTGASTLALARLLKGHITAVDFLQEFLDVLKTNAEKEALAKRYRPFAVQWITYHLEMRSLMFFGLRERYTILVLTVMVD